MMREAYLKQDEFQDAEERRGVPRKRVLSSGMIVGTDGEFPIYCTIEDIGATGAAVLLPVQLKTGRQVYLVDSHNQAAYLANIVWTRPSQVGLSFIRSYSLKQTVPAELKFLKELLLQSKLRNVQALIKRGVSLESAACTVGLSAETYSSLCAESGLDGKEMTQLRNQLNQLLL